MPVTSEVFASGVSDQSLDDLRGVVLELVDNARRVLGPNFCGGYLQGSFALGDGDQDSDVDFLIVTADEVSADQLLGLREWHARQPGSPVHWAQHLEGSYVPRAELRSPGHSSEGWWYVDNGSRELVRSGHDDSAVVRWILRDHAVVLAGPDPATLIDPITPEQLRSEARANILQWKATLHADPSAFENAWLQQHTVLAVCRALFTLHEGSVAGKVAAGRWAVEELHPAWSRLIERAIDDRPGPWERVDQATDPMLIRSTWEFLDYAADRAH